MYPDRSFSKSLRKQRGFLIPLSLFIIVAMGFLALVVSRTATQTNQSFTQELLGVEAFYAAESGAQRGMQVLFFPNASIRSAVDGRCQVLNQNYSFAAVNGLQLCNAQVTCVCSYRNGTSCASANSANYQPTSPTGVIASYYTITSVGSCGSGPLSAQRTISVGSFMDQE
jgi:MSHA biogenesis protein MshP